MRFDIITIFPDLFEPYLSESILKRARGQKLVEFRVHNLRKFSGDMRHHRVDDRPFGGGPGMVMQVEPLARAILSASGGKKIKGKTKIILCSAAGKQLNANMAATWAKKYDQIIFIAGRYEGVDDRIKKIAGAEEISIGPYVLTGGELPALVMIDAISRHIPGVLGDAESLEERRYGVGVPAYTRPEVFEWNKKKYRVPKELLSGDHKKIEEWRRKMASKHVRPDKTL